jgi:hypothetical protein
MRKALLLAVVVLGCGTTHLSARGRDVVLLDADPGSGCKSLGSVTGSADPFFGALQGDDQLVESARNDARNEAARRGATHVRFDGAPARWPSGTFGGGQGVTVAAVAYRCDGAAAPDAGSSAIGCTKDTDCKGDRICESRTCVDPKRAPAL